MDIHIRLLVGSRDLQDVLGDVAGLHVEYVASPLANPANGSRWRELVVDLLGAEADAGLDALAAVQVDTDYVFLHKVLNPSAPRVVLTVIVVSIVFDR